MHTELLSFLTCYPSLVCLFQKGKEGRKEGRREGKREEGRKEGIHDKLEVKMNLSS
jgi:hypothetical protein